MREIKFRGKNSAGWVIGSLIVNPVYTAIIEIEDPDEGTSVRHYVIPETVGQFTGLLDVDGLEIYEGDIIEALGERADVVFDVATGCFAAYPPSGPCELYRVSDDSRVIGNVHDNPDLLPNGKE